jgi:hypothetical protein
VGILGALTLATLPPRSRPVGPAAPTVEQSGGGGARRHVAAGVIHVHTVRSDGTGTVDEVAGAAARAGVQFVVFTDHGDGTREPLAPQYRSGVLCIDGVEISTEGGHYLALGLPRTPYRLAGEPRDVVDDVRRFGGVGIVAHPDSPKPELAWQEWDLPIDGLEWFNLDTEWRDESTARLALAMLHYALRPAPAIGALLRSDRPLVARWDRLARSRRLVAVAAVDAHARVGADAGPGGDLKLRVPSYEASFDTARIAVGLASPLTRDPAADAAAIVAALRQANAYGWIEAYAKAGHVEYAARRPDGTFVTMGEFAGTSLDALELRGAAAAPPGSEIRVMCDGAVALSGPAPGPVSGRVRTPAPAACRLEVHVPVGGEQRPWLITNHIYGRAADTPIAVQPPLDPSWPVVTLADVPWTVEHDTASKARFIPGTGSGPLALRFQYRLAGGTRLRQYAALVAQPITMPSDATALAFAASADRPMRVSLQLRQPDGGSNGRRWRRSIYVDTAERDVVVSVDDLRPVESGQPSHPDPSRVHAVLFVVDTLNTLPGERGEIVVRDVRFVRGAR